MREGRDHQHAQGHGPLDGQVLKDKNMFGASRQKNYLYLDSEDPKALEYSCNADEAMAYLGIKRSRLTQISGQELPCARIKLDRYLRPMYRWSDLKEYQEFHRSSELSSNTRVSTADIAKKLDHFSGEVSQYFDFLTSKHEQILRENAAMKKQLTVLMTPKSRYVSSQPYDYGYGKKNDQWLSKIALLPGTHRTDILRRLLLSRRVPGRHNNEDKRVPSVSKGSLWSWCGPVNLGSGAPMIHRGYRNPRFLRDIS
ncbi:MAG: hypothetical protein OXC40_06225 [Proteobacteria bacterium]|nr:hypothetical protein [Pseudomonadota bacterium]